MKKVTLMAAIMAALLVSCDKTDPVIDVVDFEDLTTGINGVWNGSDGSGEFTSGNISFPNSYNTEWQSWSGFAYTDHSDTTLKDYTNQYCSVTASGADKSDKYGVFYFSGKADTISFTVPEKITGIAVSNTVYAWYTMKHGNPFSKIFGGESGTDKDWFKLTLTAINSDNEPVGKVDIYLADFRFDSSSKDYISNAWTSIDLSSFGFLSKLVFEMSSSDTGDFGMNTPAYVCIDNITGELDIALE